MARAGPRKVARLRLAEAATSATGSLLVARCLNCELILGRGIGFISLVEGSYSSSCSLAETSHRKNVTSSARSVSPRNWS